MQEKQYRLHYPKSILRIFLILKGKGLYPPSCSIGNTSYTKNTKDITEKGNADNAVSLWKKAVEATAIYDIELTVLAPENMADEAKLLLQGVQSSIGSISNAEEDKKFLFLLNLKQNPKVRLSPLLIQVIMILPCIL